MKISDVMTSDVEAVNPDDTLRTAAELMADLDSGQLPVGENNLLIGAITDHDITIRAVAEGRDPENTTVRQAMSPDVLYCFEDEDVAEVSQKMGEWWVRRLPVVNQDKRLVGIVSILPGRPTCIDTNASHATVTTKSTTNQPRGPSPSRGRGGSPPRYRRATAAI